MKQPIVSTEPPAYVRDLDEAQRASIARGYCPVCNHPGFRLGPKGGVAQNIECMNAQCHARFNVVNYGWDNIMVGQFIGAADQWKGTHS